MAKAFADQIIEEIAQAGACYHRLVLVVVASGEAGLPVIEEVRRQTGAEILNVNLELSRLMLDLTEKQRILRLPRLLEEVTSSLEGEVLILKNFELLFDPSLKQDPLRLIQRISRNRTVVAFWNGAIEKGYLTYASPEHPEYRRYPIQDLLLVDTGQ